MAALSTQRTAAAAAASRPGDRVAEIFRSHGQRYRSHYRPCRAQRTVMRAIEQCRTAALGGHLEQCESCGTSRPVYNSCRNRHCPKCQSLQQARWREAQKALLLPIPYFHVVFTLPHDLNPLIRVNQRLLYALLFQAAADTLKEFAADPKHLGGELGITAVLHTWSQTLTEHVHLHCIVTGGGLRTDGQCWLPSKGPRFLFPVRALSKMVRGKLLAGLDSAYRKGNLVFIGQSAEVQDSTAWKRFLQRLRRTKWVVYAKAPMAGPEQVLDYLGRYTHRIAVSNERILGVDDHAVRFRYKDYAHGSAIKQMTVAPLEFIRRFLLHVLPPSFMRIRHYGLLANRRRAEKVARCRQLLNAAPPREPPSDESLCDRIYRLTGIDISRCPACGGGPLRITETLSPIARDTS